MSRVSIDHYRRCSVQTDNLMLKRMYAVMTHKKWSARRWAIAAGLVQQVNVQQWIMKLRKAPRDEVVGQAFTLLKMCEAAGVTCDWLLAGRTLTARDRQMAKVVAAMMRPPERSGASVTSVE